MHAIRPRYLVLSLLLLLLAAGNAYAGAGKIVVAADTTSAFFLTDTSPNLSLVGNQTFFSNVLGDGRSVVVRETSVSAFADTEVAEFYNFLENVSATVSASPLSPNSLSRIDLYVAPLVSAAFSDIEAQELTRFVSSGGTLFLLGEFNSGIGVAANGHINSLLTRMASGISIVNGVFDTGDQTAVGDQIIASPLTYGVAAFGYGGSSTILGGSPVMLLKNGSPFIAVEVSPVPEPSTFGMFVAGCALVFSRRFHRRSAA